MIQLKRLLAESKLVKAFGPIKYDPSNASNNNAKEIFPNIGSNQVTVHKAKQNDPNHYEVTVKAATSSIKNSIAIDVNATKFTDADHVPAINLLISLWEKNDIWKFIGPGTSDYEKILKAALRNEIHNATNIAISYYVNLHDENKNTVMISFKRDGDRYWLDAAESTILITQKNNATQSVPYTITRNPESGKLDLPTAERKSNHAEKSRRLARASNSLADVKYDKLIVKPGLKGRVVQEIQNVLLSLGYTQFNITNDAAACRLDEKKCDGRFGPGTEAAVIQFQKDNDLKPDGIVGPATAATLRDRWFDTLK